MGRTCILDYGSGNVASVYNMLSYLKYEAVISNSKKDIQSASHIILPGVGAFGSAMAKIKAKIPIDTLEEEVLNKKKPFLGICVGLQVLAEKGMEYGEHPGLGWIDGTVKKMQVMKNPLPHIGWNNLENMSCPELFQGLEEINDFYFVHSYVLSTDRENVIAETNYEGRFCAAVKRDNIYGVQFHPEKSQRAGQKLLQNFLGIQG